jgi:hypothetical protein
VALKGVVNIDTIGYTQSSLTAIWRESQGKGLLHRMVYLLKQIIKKAGIIFSDRIQKSQ